MIEPFSCAARRHHSHSPCSLLAPLLGANSAALSAITQSGSSTGAQGGDAAQSPTAKSASSATGRTSTVEELIKDQVTSLEKTLTQDLIETVKSEVKGRTEKLLAMLREETEEMQEVLCEDLATIIQGKAQQMQAALLDSINASRDCKDEELAQKLRDVNADLAELSEASELQDSDIDRLENERGRLAQELKEAKQKLDETNKELDDQKELTEDLLEFARRSRGEQVGLEARLEKLEAALSGQQVEDEVRGGSVGAAQEEEDEDEDVRSYSEVIPATSRAASPAYHRETLQRPRDEGNEDGDVQHPLPKRARAKVGGTLRFGRNSDNGETLVGDENEDGNARG